MGSRTFDIITILGFGIDAFRAWSMARYRLQETLAQVAVERGVTIHFNSSIERVDLDKPAVYLKDGSVHEADLIVGADGKSSANATYLRCVNMLL